MGTALMVGSMIMMVLFGMVPSIPLLWLHHRSYRAWTTLLVSTWEDWAAFLLEAYFDIKYVITGHKLEQTASIVISNHRTRLDW